MMTELTIADKIPGAKRFDINEGKHILWVVSGGATQPENNRTNLIDACAPVNHDVYNSAIRPRTLEKSREIVAREIVKVLPPSERKINDPQSVTAVLMTPAYDPGRVVGYLTAREFPSPVGPGTILYQTRAIMEEFRNQKLGQRAVQAAFLVNNQAEWDIYRTNNPIAVESAARAGIFGYKEDGSPKFGYPFDGPYSDNLIAQQLMIWSHYAIMLPANPRSPFPNSENGVRKHDLEGANPTYDRAKINAAVEKIEDRMTNKDPQKGFGMVLEEGDSITVVAPIDSIAR